MRYRELFEKRRGGNRNPKIGSSNIIKVLQNYSSRGGEYYYISYTALDKLGINPRSGYNTPVGIYSYPLVTEIMDNIEKRGLSGVPYMGEMPYIWLFRPKSNSRGLIIGKYSNRDLESDRAKLFSFVNRRDDRITSDVFEKIVSRSVSDSNVHRSVGYIWNLTRILSLILVGDHKLGRYTHEPLNLNMGDMVKYRGEIGFVSDVYSDEYRIEFSDGTDEYISFGDSDLVPYDGSDLVKYEIGDTVRIKPQSIGLGSFVKLSDGRIGEVIHIDNGFYDIYTSNGIEDMVSGKDIKLRNDYSNKTGIITDIYSSNNPLKTDYVVEIKTKDADGFKFIKQANFKYDDIQKYDEKEENEKLSKLKFAIGDLASLSNPKKPKRFKITDIDFEKGGVMLEPMDGSKPPFFWPFSRLYKGNPEYAPDVNESIITEYKKNHTGSAKSAAVMWAYILKRVLGYDYVDDSVGSGLIHANEQHQAVFFGRDTVVVVELFNNPTVKKNYRSTIAIYDVFSTSQTPEQMEKRNVGEVEAALRYLLKNNKTPSNIINRKFIGHISINSNKLKANLILRDLYMYQYFSVIDKNLQSMLDNYIIKRIRGLNENNIIDLKGYSGIIWNYFELIKEHNWSEGERALLDLVKHSDRDFAKLLVATYENNVTLIPWREGRQIVSDS